MEESKLDLNKDILRAVQSSIHESIKSVLTGYQSPLAKLVASVIESHADELRETINKSFTKAIRTEDFKQAVFDAFAHKVARSMMSGNEALFDKVHNQLKQDQVFKSKMAIAVANVVEEFLGASKK